MAQEQVIPDSLTENTDGVAESSTDETEGKSSPQDGKTESSTETNEPKSMEEAILDGLKDSLEPEGEVHTDGEGKEQVPDEVTDTDGKTDEKKDGEQESEDKPSEKPEADPDPYEMPEGLKPQAQERFKTLANENKEFKEKFTTQEEHITGVRNLFESTGATREELGKIFEYVTTRNTSKNPDELKPCLEFAENEVIRIKEAMGVVDEDTLLDKFPDLKKEVDDLTLTDERAKEIAKSRLSDKRRETASEVRTREKTETADMQQQFADDRSKASDDIRVMTEKWAKGDIDFEAKNKVLLQKSDGIFKNYPPKQWPGIFKMLYENMGVQKKPKPVNPSLESGNNGSGKKAPQTQEEAIMQKLGY